MTSFPAFGGGGIMSMEKIVYDLTYGQEENHWWFKVRRKIAFDWMKGFSFINETAAILDVGCGTGFLLGELQKRANAYGLDCADEAVEYCRARGLKNITKGDASSIPFGDEQFDIVLALDVLEHVENDVQAIKEIRRVLKKNGIAIIYVPAFQFLWGIQDKASHHFRRYRLKPLERKIKEADFEVLKVSYFNAFLFLPIALMRFFFRLLKIKIEAENEIELKPLNPVLYTIFLLESYLLKYLNFPFGVSLLFVIRKF